MHNIHKNHLNYIVVDILQIFCFKYYRKNKTINNSIKYHLKLTETLTFHKRNNKSIYKMYKTKINSKRKIFSIKLWKILICLMRLIPKICLMIFPMSNMEILSICKFIILKLIPLINFKGKGYIPNYKHLNIGNYLIYRMIAWQ